MNKGLIASIFIVFMLSIGQVHFLDAAPGEFLEVYVNYRNTGPSTIDNAQITLMIPDLNVYERSNTIDTRRGDTGVRIVEPLIPDHARAGWYPMWTILSNDEYRTWQFDWVYVE